ncbi:ornithine carbamoyltransferase [Pleomorphochaeta sp. DL1XJH-081]|jgi:ornithine carbamoyltransferase|uniref:ornithine carbamoyltransferase n=1 Tax=Pleomorphochaeta sp. DL1XJH-081 TaxID=3409690 RepID=UPI003BB6AD76
MKLTGRSFLTLKDFTSDEIGYLLDLSDKLKAKKLSGNRDLLLEGKNIVLLFDKPSTRTRCAFEVAAFDEGAHVTFLTNSQMGKKESIEDTARVLGRYYDGMQYRGSSQALVEDLAKYSGIPVWNGLTDDDHPTQVLADFMTAREHLKKPLHSMKFVYVGDGRNNMANALMIGAAKVGMDYVIATPQELNPSRSLIDSLADDCKRTKATISVESDPFKAVQGADIIYTDVWVSMGEEDKMSSRIALLQPYRVTMELMKAAGNPNVLFEHCLPAFHDLETSIGKDVFDKFGLKEMEVSDEVFHSPYSVVFDEAENRMHTIKAVMVATMSDKLQ